MLVHKLFPLVPLVCIITSSIPAHVRIYVNLLNTLDTTDSIFMSLYHIPNVYTTKYTGFIWIHIPSGYTTKCLALLGFTFLVGILLSILALFGFTFLVGILLSVLLY